MATLACHPDTPDTVVRAIVVRLAWATTSTLRAAWLIEGELGRIAVPDPRPPRVAGELWRHTCCELFVRPRGTAQYYEFNLAPSGEWAVLAFERYRCPAPDSALAGAHALDPAIVVRRDADRLELEALLRLDRLPPPLAAAPLGIALSAVIESRAGSHSYWALRHPAGRPDFHHADAFCLELPGAAPGEPRAVQ